MAASAGTGHGIVTPEAVLLDLTPAGIASRALARTIDLAAQGGIVLAVFLALAFSGFEGTAAVVVAISVVALALFAYPALFELLWRGRTPGKAALGLRVVTVEGAPVRAVHAFTRSALQLIDFLLPPIGLLAVLSALFTRRSQRIGDLVAGTLVLSERSAEGPPMAVAFSPPPGWEPYALSLDLGSVDDDDYELVRSFLLRVGELEPGARAALAMRLAEPLAARMGHTPPPGVHPEPFLVCVAAAHQRRSALRHQQSATP